VGLADLRGGWKLESVVDEVLVRLLNRKVEEVCGVGRGGRMLDRVICGSGEQEIHGRSLDSVVEEIFLWVSGPIVVIGPVVPVGVEASEKPAERAEDDNVRGQRKS
jgi:hypothetical protein